MKHWISTFAAIVAVGLASGVQAQDQSKMKDAERRARDQLPAEPPKASTGTVKGPSLTKPDTDRKVEPKFKEVPSPVSGDRRTREGQIDRTVAEGWDKDRERRKRQ